MLPFMWKSTALTRSNKQLPNVHIHDTIASHMPPGFDGEIEPVIADDVPFSHFGAVTSAVMKQTGKPDFLYTVFDHWDPTNHEWNERYDSRYDRLRAWVDQNPAPWLRVVPTTVIHHPDDLAAYLEKCLAEGYEGVCTRLPAGHYKKGRSTLREQGLMKIKIFEDSEATIVDINELYVNRNEAKQNETGYQIRSTHQENMVPAGTLGSFTVKDKTGATFNIGTGFTLGDRDALWEKRNTLLGATVKYKHQPYGRKNAPRLPVFLGIRDEKD